MLPNQAEVLMKANGLNLSMVKIEILYSVTIPENFKKKSETLLQEYRQFLAIKVIFGDTKLPLSLSPSAIIDQVWHIHMLMPGNYANCCRELGVDIIEHDPSAARDALSIRRKRLEMTKNSYQVAFQKIPPEEFWAVTYNIVAYRRPSTSSSSSDSDEDEELPAQKKIKLENSSDQKSSSNSSDSEEDEELQADQSASTNGSDQKATSSSPSESEEDPVTHSKVQTRSDYVAVSKAQSKNQGDDSVTFLVLAENINKSYNVKIKKSTPFKKVFDWLEATTGWGNGAFILHSPNQIISRNDTVNSLQLENDDVVEMRAIQSGC